MKTKRYDGEDDSEVFAGETNDISDEDRAAMKAVKQPKVVTKEQKPKVVTKEQLQAFKTKYGADKDLTDYMNAQQGLTRRGGYGPGRKPSGPSQQDTTDTRDRFGIPTSMGNAGKDYAPTGKAAESASGSELMRNLEAAASATGAGGILQGVRRGTAGVKGLREFAAGRMGAKEVAKRIEPTMEAAKKSAPSVNVRPSAADPKIMDEFGGAMRRGGAVKKMASGGSTSSRADGIAQRGKTKGKFC